MGACKVAAESCQLDDVVRDGNSDAATDLVGSNSSSRNWSTR